MDVTERGGAAPRDVGALFAAVAGIGPFFAVGTGPRPAGGGWVPVGTLGAGPVRGDDPLSSRTASVRAALRTDDRVAASTVFQALAAQLVAPLFAAVAVEGLLPVAAGGPAGRLYWRPGGAGPWLWWSGGGRVEPCPDAAVLGGVLTALLAPVVAGMRARVSVAERVLWGDAASAVGSARRLVAAARPAAADRATAVAEHLLTTPPLARTATLRPPEPPDGRWTFRRRSCCLYHRVPGGAVCGDCVLLDRRPRGPRGA